VYSAGGFDVPWSPAPDTTVALNTADWDHVAVYKQVLITTTSAAVTGSLSMDTDTLKYQTPYTLTAVLSSEPSPGALRNPEMRLTLPAGQQYVPGSVELEYPRGTSITLPSSVETDLTDLNAVGVLNTDRLYPISLKEMLGGANVLMAGYLAQDVTLNGQNAVFTARFSPECGTRLTGIRYMGELPGESACELPATGNGQVRYSATLPAEVSNNYGFSATLTTTSGNRAFNDCA